jgi:hypothetical protein
MHPRWTPSLLIISQALLVGALPAPRQSGQLDISTDSKCNETETPFSDQLLTSRAENSGVVAVVHTLGPPIETSYPAGKNPFAGPGPYPPFVPNFNIKPTQASQISETESSVTSSPTGQHSRRYTSEITYLDPHLSIQTVTITDLPSSQEPTVTSASQSNPDTTGVRIRRSGQYK